MAATKVQTGALSLSRAITACTQPTAQLSGDVLRTLQKYLADAQSVDHVYCMLVDRALAEPLSAAIAAKVIAILKQLLLRHPPSSAVLGYLTTFCNRLPAVIPLQPNDFKALQYVGWCVQRLERAEGGGGAGGKSVRSSRSPVRIAGLVRLTQSTSSQSNSRQLHGGFQPLPTVPSGPFSTGDAATLSSAESGPARLTGGRTSAATASMEGRASVVLPDLSTHSATAAAAAAPLLLPAEPGSTPSWALPPLLTLQELLAPMLMPAGSARPAGLDTRWIAHVPQLNPRLTASPYNAPLWTPDGELSTVDVLAGGLPVAGAGISVASLQRCVLDLSPAEQPAQLEQVVSRLHAEAAQARAEASMRASEAGSRPSRLGPKGGAAGPAPPVGRKRHLFHHPPYTQSDPLHLSEADIAVVVEVVCGAAAAHALLSPAKEESMLYGRPAGAGAAESTIPEDGHASCGEGEGDSGGEGGGNGEVAGPAAASWEDAFDDDGLGEVCVSILLKLIMDMWVAAGPGNSFVLVLRMLRKALTSPKPQIRARVYDLVYNLAIHACLLEPVGPPPETGAAAWDAAVTAAATAAAAAVGSPPLVPSVHASSDGPPPSALPEARSKQGGAAYAAMRAWNRALLFALLSDTARAGEEDEGVWQAALGALLQLCCHGGHWVAASVEALPLDGVAGLLRAALAFQWADDLHCHLLRLAAALLVQGDTGPPGANGHGAPDELDAPGSSAYPPPRAPPAPPSAETSGGEHALPESRVSRIPAGFGGLHGVLEALAHAPNAAGCLDMLAVLVHYLTPDDATELALARVLASRGAPLFALAVQQMVRAPRKEQALQLSAALSGVGVPRSLTSASSSSGGAAPHLPGSPTAYMMGGGAAATIRALGAIPQAVTPHSAVVLDSASLLPAHSARLVADMLRLVEAEGLKARRALQGSSRLMQLVKATVTHITSATLPPQHVDPSVHTTAAPAWAELKAVCGLVNAERLLAEGPGAVADPPKGAGGGGGGGLGSSLSSAQWASITSLAASAGPLTPIGRSNPAGHHARSASMLPTSSVDGLGGLGGGLVFMGNGLSGSVDGPLGMPRRGTIRRGGTRSMGGRGDEDITLRGSVVIMSPPTAAVAGRQAALYWLFKVLTQALSACKNNPLLLTPLNLRTSESGKLSASGGGPPTPSGGRGGVAPWTAHLADALLYCVREVVGGCRLLVAAIVRAVADIKQHVVDAGPRHRLVLSAYHIALQWVLQSGDGRPGSNSHLAAQELADQVLAAISQPRVAVEAMPITAAALAGNSASFAGSAFLRPRASLAGKRPPGAGGSNAGPPSGLQLPVATALLVGAADFAPDILPAVAPELLVALIRTCAQQRTAAHGMMRGLYGRPVQGRIGLPSFLNADGPGPAPVPAPAPAPAGPEGPDAEASRHGSQSGAQAGARPAVGGDAEVEPRVHSSPAWADAALDRCLALLMALMARCAVDPEMFAKYGLSHLVKEVLLPSEDPRERYYAGVYLLRHWQLNQQDKYWRMLRQLVLQAQSMDEPALLDNPYLTVVHMLNVEG